MLLIQICGFCWEGLGFSEASRDSVLSEFSMLGHYRIGALLSGAITALVRK